MASFSCPYSNFQKQVLPTSLDNITWSWPRGGKFGLLRRMLNILGPFKINAAGFAKELQS